MNIYHHQLQMLDGDMVFPSFEDVLGTIGRGISTSSQRINEACASGDEEWADVVTDQECDVIEELLGTSFVVSQVYITSVVSRLMRLHERSSTTGVLLKSFKPTRKSILRTSALPCANTGCTQVQVLDAFANYFKHRCEWRPIDWSKSNKHSQKTIAIVRAAGATEGCSGNLRTGAEVLGNHDFAHVLLYSTILKDWVAGIRSAVEIELEFLGLL